MPRSYFLTVLICPILALPLKGQDDESQWSVSAGARYLSRYTAYGVDLSNNLAAASYGLGVQHEGGFSVGAGLLQTLGTGGELQHWSVEAGYDWQAAEWLTLSADFSHYGYTNDSANVLAALANSISLGAEADLDIASVGLSYDAYLGSNSAGYISLDISTFHMMGDLIILPMAQMTFMSQTVEDRLLKSSARGSGSGQGPGSGSGSGSSAISTATTLTGLSSVSVHVVFVYPLFNGLTVSLHPSYLYSPKSELSSSNSQFLWSAGLRYSINL